MEESVIQDTVDGVMIDSDEDGFHLILSGEKAEYRFYIHAIAVELLRAVDREIRPWWLEGENARRETLLRKDWSEEWETLPEAPPLVPREAYERTDPKSPYFYETMAELHDSREGK